MPFLRILAFFVLFFAAMVGRGHAASDIRVAYQPSPLYAPLFVAKANKWVEEELAASNMPGVKVTWAVFAAGPAMNESFAAGQQDVGFMGDAPALIGRAAGIDSKVIGISVSSPKGLGLVVAADSPFLAIKDLKGKKIAVTKGSYAHHFLDLALEREGMSKGDIVLINMPVSEIPSAILSGAIDAGAVWEPLIARFESARVLRVLIDATGLKSGAQPILASVPAIEEKRAAVEAVLRAYARGAAFLRADPKAAAVLASKDAGLSPELLEKVFVKQNFYPSLGDADISELEKTEVYMRKNKLLRSTVDVKAWVDRSFSQRDKAEKR